MSCSRAAAKQTNTHNSRTDSASARSTGCESLVVVVAHQYSVEVSRGTWPVRLSLADRGERQTAGRDRHVPSQRPRCLSRSAANGRSVDVGLCSATVQRTCHLAGGTSPRVLVFQFPHKLQSIYRTRRDATVVVVFCSVQSVTDEHDITLSGGSLGSCVDEERSQLREVM